MSANRLNRDQILLRALNMVDSPTLDAKERPNGTIVSTAMCITWLQEGLDYAHTRHPVGTTLLQATITWVAGQTRYAVPSDFIQDYENGIIHVDNEVRLERKGLSALLNIPKINASSWGRPAWYAIAGTEIVVRPAPSADMAGKTATLVYYGMPATLGASDVPKFPSDIVLVRYVWLRGLEWTRAVAPGTAEKYLLEVVGDLQRQGVSNEAEPQQIPFDRNAFPGARHAEFDWMGQTTVS